MYYFASINWDTVGVICAVIVAVVTAVSFIIVKVFNLGKVAQRLTDVEDGITDVKTDVDKTKKDLTKEIKESRKDLTNRIDEVLTNMALKQVSQSQSPRALNDFGNQVLEQSGIRAIIEPKVSEIVAEVKANKPENPYQVQEMLLDIVKKLKDTDLKDSIEQAAFKSGVTVETVLLVAGIDIRDTVLQKLDMNPNDIDSYKP